MAENSFDIVCKIDRQELQNAIDLTRKELANRFDFKGAKATVEIEGDNLVLEASDQMRRKQLIEIVQSKAARRNLSLKALPFVDFETNVSGLVKCRAAIQAGLNQEQCKEIVRMIKDSKQKVQVRIQGDSVRVTGKSKDDLQAIQKLIRDADLPYHTAFDNYR